MYDLLKHYGGTLEVIDDEDFERYVGEVTARLAEGGRTLSRDPSTGEIVERTGLLTGIGILKAIDRGIIAPGERVVYLLTGGIRSAPQFKRVEPRCVVDETRSDAEWVAHVGELLGLRPFEYRRASDHLFDRTPVDK